MPEVIDNEARERVAELDKRFMELSTDYWGPRRDNGTRSMVREHATKLDTLEREMRHYVDTRPDTCLGLKALAEHEATEGALYDETKEGDTEVKVAEMQSKTEKSKIRGTIIAAAITAAFMFAGQAVVATQASATQRSVTQLTELVQTLEAHR